MIGEVGERVGKRVVDRHSRRHQRRNARQIAVARVGVHEAQLGIENSDGERHRLEEGLESNA